MKEKMELVRQPIPWLPGHPLGSPAKYLSWYANQLCGTPATQPSWYANQLCGTPATQPSWCADQLGGTPAFSVVRQPHACMVYFSMASAPTLPPFARWRSPCDLEKSHGLRQLTITHGPGHRGLHGVEIGGDTPLFPVLGHYGIKDLWRSHALWFCKTISPPRLGLSFGHWVDVATLPLAGGTREVT